MNEKGTISVHTEHIFPIIKKFLYSDQDIFLRELVANGVDAVQKLKKLAAMGLYDGATDKLQVEVLLDTSAKTLTIKDDGLGMTADEIKQYINQIAFSGAAAFVEKYKEQVDQHQLIGFFGLGFYSAFMVAKKVEIITKSYQKDSQATHWSCDGSTNFEIQPTEKSEVGTTVILHLAEDAEEFLKPERIHAILDKHCRFLPVEIVFDKKVINNTTPLWIKRPTDLQPEDYLTFYKELYPFAGEPLFWIHLSIDYPFTLTGILYFPKAANYFEQKETIQLYARQVFITNDVKEVIPDFLRLLHGIIDSPDIPLNVSRSALQADSNVKKINTYIAKKVAEKLETLFQQDRKAYEAKWNDISLFIKYGMITDPKFDEKIRDIVLLQNTTDRYYTITEYKDIITENQTDKHGNVVVLYTTDPKKQAAYLQTAQQKGYDVLMLNSQIDTNFINFLEYKLDKVKFKGIDTDTIGKLIEKEEAIAHSLTEEERARLQSIYEKTIGTEQTTWNVAAMLPEELPVSFITSEHLKRMAQFTQGNEAKQHTFRAMDIAINGNHLLAKKILTIPDEAVQKRLVEQAYQLALLAQGLLEGELLAGFIQRYTDNLLDAS
ncbi:MAG: molecular chaperone HtpG [Candidatus Cardinium sp.]|uniref:molecular chaperone HtpG n=1 Tax=Cardinium endosymbiont of Dermatophagoides farinae TaxID=2597823 RepID=UPI00118300A0|nr:molecular chaperone HtpG [Cardinium endosymbiont of Dermatophagoides farinae]TSJ81414.1 molecular chaperone HtpG [Cardinium endosymbiont of Dermatophagoides farinae]UWW97476.1 MAG: molecular chaperone HtpG [Candidatus Cardinium sp.]